MKLALVAICLIGLAMAVALVLVDGPPDEAMGTYACSTPTPAPTSHAADRLNFCNETDETADGLLFYVLGPMGVTPTIVQNPAGCSTPEATASESAPDFTNTITVAWPATCVQPGNNVEIRFDCFYGGSTTEPCQPSLQCFNWSVGGQTIGSPCPTPNCGGVPCCNGLPCPTPTQTPHPTRVAVPPGTPGDYDCDEFIALGDAIRLQAELAGVPLPALGRPAECPPVFNRETWVTPHVMDS